jgi:precorrin-8X/cobalt-precorrin-8 methylmutase
MTEKKPFIYNLFEHPISGAAIEAASFRIIDAEAPPHTFSPDEWQVVRRMIHTTGDFSIMAAIRFSPDAVSEALKALRDGRSLYVDANMIRAGLSVERLQSVNGDYHRNRIVSHIADPDVAEDAHASGLPRSLFAIRKARPMLDGGIAVFGNAPVALLELNRMILEENIRPALVVAMPVGFVHVIESKEELLSMGVPCITLTGRRGGSPLAVSVIHALCSLAAAPERGSEKADDR